ncbi:MAG: gamma-glutamylcyclotransferase [Pseudomonadota bacterium]
MTDDATDTRLAVYGTLGPGRANHHVLAPLGGRWLAGQVRGRLIQSGWGAAMGYPGIVLDPGAGTVAVDLLVSPALAAQWGRLDAFEGEGYRRVVTEVATAEGALTAWIYEVVQPEGA